MSLFSERYGHKKPRDAFQINGIDTSLQNRIWNTFQIEYLNKISFPENKALVITIWTNLFKLRYDEIEADLDYTHRMTSLLIKEFFRLTWIEIYDFIDFVIKFGPPNNKTIFIHVLNQVFEEEMSGYRVVADEIAPIIDKTEIEEIEKAQAIKNDPIRLHLHRALELLSDKENPDYRNSIKESISAVEVLCKLIARTPRSSLADALKAIEQQGQITFHGAEKSAFEKLYGWTSDAEGIRHGMMDLPNLSQEDARFILITCSAFINYLQEKARKSGLLA